MTISVIQKVTKPEKYAKQDAPSLAILYVLTGHGAIIKAHDPTGIEEARLLLPFPTASKAYPEEAVAVADAVVLLTERNRFRGPDLI